MPDFLLRDYLGCLPWLQCQGYNFSIYTDNHEPGVARYNLFFCFIASRICCNKLYAQDNYPAQQKKPRITPSNSLLIFSVNGHFFSFTLLAFRL